MKALLFSSHPKSRLRRILIVFLLCLGLPFLGILARVYSQLQEETYYQFKQQAEELALRIDDKLDRVLTPEELRPYNEYQFFTVEDAPLLATKEIAFSPLSQLPLQSSIPGILGYFELTPENNLRTPYLPSLSDRQLAQTSLLAKLSPEAIRERSALRDKIEKAIRSVNEEEQAAGATAVAKADSSQLMQEPELEILGSSGASASQQEATAESSVGSEAQAPAPPVLVGSRSITKKKRKAKSAPSKFSKQVNNQSISSLKLNTKYWSEDSEQSVAQRALSNSVREKRSARVENVVVPSRKGAVDKLQIIGQSGSLQQSKSEQISRGTRAEEEIAPQAAYGSGRRRESRERADSGASGPVEGNAEKKKALLEMSKTFKEMFQDDALDGDIQDSVAGRQSKQELSASERKPSREASRVSGVNSEKDSNSPIGIETFVASIDPLQGIRLNQEYLMFFRRVWKKDGRFLQGFIAENEAFFAEVVRDEFAKSALSEVATLVIGYEGEVLTAFRPAVKTISSRSSFGSGSNRIRESSRVDPSSDRLLLARRNLPPPLESFELLYTIDTLPTTAGVFVIHAFAASFLIVLLVGTVFIYRLGIGHIELAEQRSNFVSAVSHELKTPLTSIRMYGEMLREGWVQDPEKQRSYYDFIFHESERLSRLIGNVLRLSSLDSQNEVISLKHCTASQLLSLIESKIQSMTEAADFEVVLNNDQSAAAILVDEDGFVQIFVNLVDNAIKFSGDAESRKVELSFRTEEKNSKKYGVFTVRDFGPGIEKAQLKNIFELFYRGENEMTRSTPGTGIGLALVQELTRKMDGFVSVSNETPGAAFHIWLPIADA